jgi:hypothetical protein
VNTRRKELMYAPQDPFYDKDESETMADVRDAMSRRGDFNPSPERYGDEAGAFEVLAALKALTVEGEVLV